jgi:hypothetical protein
MHASAAAAQSVRAKALTDGAIGARRASDHPGTRDVGVSALVSHTRQ